MTLRRETGEDGGARASDRAAAGAARRGGGFTLVELLVAIAIIGVLLGLVASGLTSARKSARGAVCLSNMHQIGVAWIEYMGDHDEVFPFRRTDAYAGHFVDWGGVDWYDEHAPNSVRVLYKAERPVNPYLGDDLRITNDMKVFRCPADNGLWYGGVTPFYSDEIEVTISRSEDPTASIYGTRGVSYFANEWIWLKPGSTLGWTERAYIASLGTRVAGFLRIHPATSLKNRSTDVLRPSQFVLVGDMDWLQTARIPKENRSGRVINGRHTGWPYGFWHGAETPNVARLDGSAARIKIQESIASNSEYDFWLDPTLHGPGSTVLGMTYYPASNR